MSPFSLTLLYLSISLSLSLFPSHFFILPLEGNDYTAVSAMIEFPAGVTRRCVPLGILDDAIVEGDEQLTLTATILTPIPGASIGPIGTTTVTILDPVDREYIHFTNKNYFSCSA